ncbi:nuclear receptor 2C2-associated protein-like isoform X2 [Orbicella faveolata]|uniref:nuclear receptor 2C2-associated protein-like isoform X2 n=1 Tax=Orbicella faveolata TaxID=48498 RepID=UPI0009E56B14|nr:nuclear receptor 2C2-associated protein-like isoform X2 [Orbicella faveolata]
MISNHGCSIVRSARNGGKVFVINRKYKGEGSPQFVILEFPEESCVREIHIQFQGGFVGKECCLEGGPSCNSLTPFFTFYPDDVGSLQIFPITSSRKLKVLKIVFISSSDLFGRITVYKLDVLGC